MNRRAGPASLDFLLAAQALPQPGQRIVRITEVVEEDVHGVVEVLEPVRIEPHFPLPCRAGQGYDRGHYMEAVMGQVIP
jgi:hypothetical protein